MTDLRQTPEYATYMQKTGWIVERIPAERRNYYFYVYIRKLPFLPLSTIKIQRFDKPIDLLVLRTLSKKYRCISLMLEPDSNFKEQDGFLKQLHAYGFTRISFPYLPTQTIQIDLTSSTKKILQGCSARTRTYIRKSKTLSHIHCYRNANHININRFHSFLRRAGKGYIPSYSYLLKLITSFGNRSLIVISEREGRLLSAILLLFTQERAYYFFAATNKEGRRMLSGYACVWTALMKAKRYGVKVFDFEGIYDERFPVFLRWKNFTQFKTRFGGKVVSFPGSFQYARFPLRLFVS